MKRVLCTWVLVGVVVAVPTMQPNDAQSVFDRAIDEFTDGNIEASAAAFDELVSIVPDLAPGSWQRGIVLYYAGRYEDCRAQFESHRTVNPADVENATWHFLCVARSTTPAEARSALLPVGADSRVPMQEIYDLYSGTLTPEDVMTAADGRPQAEFYAHLYLGLYAEALGDHERALEHIRAAAVDEYARAGGYMHTVARVHLALSQGN